MSEELLTVSEAAEKLSVSKRTIQRYCKQGRLNFKWAQGPRHREIRILPPLPLHELPGVHHKADIDASDLVTRDDFDGIIVDLRRRVLDQERRIDELEHELDHRQQGAVLTPAARLESDEQMKKIDSIIADFDTIRPVEKELVLRVAHEVKRLADRLDALQHDRDIPPVD